MVDLARPAGRRMRCPFCGYTTRATCHRSLRTWRHLDARRTVASCAARCAGSTVPPTGVVSEEVPWARAGSRFTMAFEDTCAWLARDAPKTVLARLLRIDWATVGRMIERVVDDALADAPDALEGLRRIGSMRSPTPRATATCSASWITTPAGSSGPAPVARRRPLLPSSAISDLSERASLRPPRSICTAPARGDPHDGAPGGDLRRSLLRRQARRGGLGALRRADWQRLRREDPERAR